MEQGSHDPCRPQPTAQVFRDSYDFRRENDSRLFGHGRSFGGRGGHGMDFQNHSTSQFDGWLQGDDQGRGIKIDGSIITREQGGGRGFLPGFQDWRSSERRSTLRIPSNRGASRGFSAVGNPLWSRISRMNDKSYYKEVPPLFDNGM